MNATDLQFIDKYITFLFELGAQLFGACLLFVGACFACGWVIRRRRRASIEHQRLSNLPPLPLLTARYIINLNASERRVDKRAARHLAEMAGWRLSDVIGILQARYSLEPYELDSDWTPKLAEAVLLLREGMTGTQIKAIISPLID